MPAPKLPADAGREHVGWAEPGQGFTRQRVGTTGTSRSRHERLDTRVRGPGAPRNRRPEPHLILTPRRRVVCFGVILDAYSSVLIAATSPVSRFG
jgi:hypothetical protein